MDIPENIRQGLPLAYLSGALAKEKSSITLTPVACSIKLFTAVIIAVS
jgi:hypothetical protein